MKRALTDGASEFGVVRSCPLHPTDETSVPRLKISAISYEDPQPTRSGDDVEEGS